METWCIEHLKLKEKLSTTKCISNGGACSDFKVQLHVKFTTTHTLTVNKIMMD